MRGPFAVVACVSLTLSVTTGALAQDPGAPMGEPKPRVLTLDLEAIDVEPGTATLVTRLVTDAVAASERYEVISAAEIRQLVALESERQLVDCDTSSCLSEIAGAMGARYVVFGTVGRLGTLVVVSLGLFDSNEARAIARERFEVSSEEQLPSAIDATVARLLGEDLPAQSAPASSTASPDAPPLPWLLYGGVGVGALGLLTVVGGGVAALIYDGVLSDAKSLPDAKQAALDARPWVLGVVVTGLVVGVAGGALAGVGAVVAE